MSAENKPKLSVEEQVAHLRQKGVKFEIISEEGALEYLSKNNNYFKLTAYRKTFLKHNGGKDDGKYINLEFAYLKDLAIIDMRLRYALLHLALDIEHYAKVRLIQLIENRDEDGYTIVNDFIESLSDDQKKSFLREIDRNRDNPYCGSIIHKYEGEFPIWAFVEVIPFGRFTMFYKYCADYFEDRKLANEYYLLLSVKALRNATAHSNCIINDLSANTANRQTSNEVSIELGKIPGVSKTIRRRKMSNVRIQQIVTLLYTHKKIVTSSGVHQHQCEVLHDVLWRMFHHIDYYATNDTIKTTFDFIKVVIDNWFPKEYNTAT